MTMIIHIQQIDQKVFKVRLSGCENHTLIHGIRVEVKLFGICQCFIVLFTQKFTPSFNKDYSDYILYTHLLCTTYPNLNMICDFFIKNITDLN